MDPISPIPPEGTRLPSLAAPPVERLQRVSRERDRPARDRPDSPARRQPPPTEPDDESGEDDRPRVDVRV
ncbi:MAG: hypothetical protein ACLQBB_05755 [Solirubrobacteraceae bacterium]